MEIQCETGLITALCHSSGMKFDCFLFDDHRFLAFDTQREKFSATYDNTTFTTVRPASISEAGDVVETLPNS